jgi:hypothetical protein
MKFETKLKSLVFFFSPFLLKIQPLKDFFRFDLVNTLTFPIGINPN